jgi:DNA-binding transcriptional regulator YiaG
MSYGYSLRLIERNSQANENKLGVQLGRVCIKQNVPVSVVAGRFGVTRQTVYNWFSGISNPAEPLHGLVTQYISALT